MKTKIRTYGDKIYTDFRSLNVGEDNMRSESFTVISIDSFIRKQILPASIFRQLYL